MLRVDAEIMEAIEKWAADEFRSTNGQLQWIIAEALRKSGRNEEKEDNKSKRKKQNDTVYLMETKCFLLFVKVEK